METSLAVKILPVVTWQIRPDVWNRQQMLQEGGLTLPLGVGLVSDGDCAHVQACLIVDKACLVEGADRLRVGHANPAPADKSQK